MPNLYKRVLRCVPAYAEALGVRSPEEMQFIVEENGRLVFRPPGADLVRKMAEQAAKQQPKIEHQPAKPQPATPQRPAPPKRPPPLRRKAEPISAAEKQANAAVARQARNGDPKLKVDLDKYPDWPKHMTVRKHVPDGQFYWDPMAVDLYSSPRQAGHGVDGHALRTELKGRRLCNVNLLRWLMKNRRYIPVWWRRNARKIFFWGTIFLDMRGNACVLYITSSHQRWMMGVKKLDEKWSSRDFAAQRI